MSLMMKRYIVICRININNSKKILNLLRALYDQRKSFLLWLRILIDKCIEFELNFISSEFCLFFDDNDILMFFYVNDIVFAFTASRKRNVENLIRRLIDIFDMRNLNSLNFSFSMCEFCKTSTRFDWYRTFI
jgi:hypothetical protein